MNKLLHARVAIIGMACEYPGAHSPVELWKNLLAGRRQFRKMPAERMPASYFDADPAAAGKSYCDLAAVLEGWCFDPLRFGIAPLTVQASDISHWLALTVAQAAMQHAGIDLNNLDRTRMGVILGNTLCGEFSRSHPLRHRWPYVERALRNAARQQKLSHEQIDELAAALRQQYESPLPEITEDSLAGNMANTIAGRICNYFDLGGGGYIVDGACSSSLLAISHACDALERGDLDLVISGGVDVSLDPFEIIGFAKARALARDDIRPYAANANGMLPGEGCGMFVLMRESDARRAAYPIRALISGWAISSDGAGGITEPGLQGQVRALEKAYRRAGYPLASVGLIEGHGTGTVLGDKVEISALQTQLANEAQPANCRLGSIKGNIGHCKAAAGSAGLIKAVMALQRKLLPPSVNCATPHPLFSASASLRVQQHGQAWPAGSTPRRAAVSAMGFGGANAHLTLEEANPDDAADPADLALLGSAQSSELLLLSAPDIPALRTRLQQLHNIAQRISLAELTDLSAALAEQTDCAGLRLAIVTPSPWALSTTLEQLLQDLDDDADIHSLAAQHPDVFAGTGNTPAKFVALFPGQGSQFLQMGSHLQRRFSFVQDLFSRTESVVTTAIAQDTSSASQQQVTQWQHNLQATQIAQPAITLHSMATLEVLRHLGLHPDLTIGHSLGEISALAASGAWTAATAVQLANCRGQAFNSLTLQECGSMLAIHAAADEVQALLGEVSSYITVANQNAPGQTVVAGTSSAITEVSERCRQRGWPARQLNVSHAFHSDIVAAAAPSFIRHAGELLQEAHPGRLAQVISSVTGTALDEHCDLSALLSRQIGAPVHFMQAVRCAAREQPSLWVELGPGNVLCGLTRAILDHGESAILPTDIEGQDGFHLLNRVLAAAYAAGCWQDTGKLFSQRFYRPFDIDNFAPQFIVNPCERGQSGNDASTLPARNTATASGTGSGSSAPSSHFPLRPQHIASASGAMASVPDHASLHSLAAQWINARTGFPVQMIHAHTKLRIDLNLDSIKVGELAVYLAGQCQQRLAVDPLALSNASIEQIIAAICDTPLADQVTTANTSIPSRATLPELQPLISTFEMHNEAVALATEAPVNWRGQPSLMILGGAPEQASMIGHMLGAQIPALRITTSAHALPLPAAMEDADFFILLLPASTQNFLACSRDEFEQDVFSHAEFLFDFAQALLKKNEKNLQPLRGMIVRFSSGNGEQSEDSPDLDAGAAFFKSLQQEHPELAIKWLTLPGAWSLEQSATVIASESTVQQRSMLSYSHDGSRLARVARPIHPQTQGMPLDLTPDDVVLVSGGARGVGFALALQLARHSHAALALVGSTAAAALDAESKKNFSLLEQEGISYLYLQADISDLHAVRQAVAQAEHTLGTVTAILHGAGISNLCALQDKTKDEFLQCIRIKAGGLFNLLTAIASDKLRMLHVISSVLAHTGMRGQTDYCFANAWLDGAVRIFRTAHPHVHCLSLAYSVWSETGLGRDSGALASLQAAGITALTSEQGMSAYRQLLAAAPTTPAMVITGKLNSAFENALFGYPAQTQGRFLEQVLRWIPGQQVIAEAVLSHAHDLYLAEHVYQGTSLFPAVMAIEAMVQIAQACAASSSLPVLREIHFRHAIAVPENDNLTIRILAQVESRSAQQLQIKVVIRSASDQFQRDAMTALCCFETEQAPAQQSLDIAALPASQEIDVEMLSPVPLFQGKFFRRIQAVRQLKMGDMSLTSIAVPQLAQYYRDGAGKANSTASPAARDAALQSGALILPPGCLPVSIKELRFHHPLRDNVYCQSTVQQHAAGNYDCDCFLFDGNGALIESMQGIQLRAPQTALQKRSASQILPFDQSVSIEAQLPGALPCALAFASGSEKHSTAPSILTMPQSVPAAMAQHKSNMADLNLLAASRAIGNYAASRQQKIMPSDALQIHHADDGSPVLSDPALPPGLGLRLSLAHTGRLTVALISEIQMGIDLETVVCRDCETWRGLLGADGYALALHWQGQCGESFDCTATRVWTLIEAQRKAALPATSLASWQAGLNGPFLSGTLTASAVPAMYVSVALQHPEQMHKVLILSIASHTAMSAGSAMAAAA